MIGAYGNVFLEVFITPEVKWNDSEEDKVD